MTTDMNHTDLGGAGVPPAPDDSVPPPHDELDGLLSDWHDANAAQARAGRDRLLAALVKEDAAPAPLPFNRNPFVRVVRSRLFPTAAAAAILLAVMVAFLLPQTTSKSFAAGGTILCPDGGRLDALDPDGNVLGPCELKHTDVKAEVSGFYTRVTLRQQYHNPHTSKIEAVYTFPMSHRAAVDRMTMTVGDRVIVGEVKERQKARDIYDAARAEGRVASLLEQERPNIFTQSIANIEPGAAIDIEISYVEILEARDGTYSFEFPTVVGPRYIPGTPTGSSADSHLLPAPLKRRPGLVLLAPATIRITTAGDTARGQLTPAQLRAALASSIATTGPMPRVVSEPHFPPLAEWYRFTVEYPDGSGEPGVLYPDGTGIVNTRWFFAPSLREGADVAPTPGAEPGSGFATNTNQVPDASKITPMPVRPPTRAGHDISISVTIDTGGPAIRDLASTLHEIVRTDGPARPEGGPGRTIVSLKKNAEIPNRDFILSWKTAGESIQESTLAHTGKNGNFLSLILQPPARVEPEQIVPRELIFVLDTSGSMNGYPIEKSKELAAKAIDQMRPGDTFNFITFAGDTHILWNQPRPNTAENRAEAQKFVASRSGGGGTEMMKAINAALAPSEAGDAWADPISWEQLLGKPGDGSRVVVNVYHPEIILNAKGAAAWGRLRVVGQSDESKEFLVTQFELPSLSRSDTLLLSGQWTTVNSVRVLKVDSVEVERVFGPTGRHAAKPLRMVLFLTDAYVGNEFAILDSIKANRGTTRVFSFGIGNSVNRFLIDGMARLGGGEPEFVSLASDADAAVERLVRRISSPVLANIKVEFTHAAGATAKLVDMLPVPTNIPDLYDQRPLNLIARYTGSGKGTLVITGDTAAGPYKRELALDLPAAEPAHDTVATLWARAKVDSLMNEDLKAVQAQAFPDELKQEVVRLGETFGIMTQYTSFVAVDKLRVTLGGKPRLVHIPIELPAGVSWEGNFGGGQARNDLIQAGLELTPVMGERAVGYDPTVVLQWKATGEGYYVQDPTRKTLNLNAVDTLHVRAIDAQALGDAESERKQFYGVTAAAPNTSPSMPASPPASPPPAPGRSLAPPPVSGSPLPDMDERVAGRPATTAEPAKPGSPTASPKPSAAAADALTTGPTSSAGQNKDETDRAKAPARPAPTPAMTAPPEVVRQYVEEHKSSENSAARSPRRSLGSAAAPGSAGGTPSQPSLQAVDPSIAVTATSILRVPVRTSGIPSGDLRGLSSGAAGREGITIGKNEEEGRALLRYRDDSLGDAAETSRPIPHTVPADWIAVRIAALVAKPAIDDARALAAKLAAAAPTYEIGVEMNKLLHEPAPVDQAQFADKSPIDAPASPAAPPPDTKARDARIAELGAKAKARLDELVRQATLAHRLDPRLLRFANGSVTGLPTSFYKVYDGPWPEGAQTLDGGILLSVLLADTERSTLDALKAAGFRVDQVAKEASVVIGIQPIGRLADLALVNKVRRVEPTE